MTEYKNDSSIIAELGAKISGPTGGAGSSSPKVEMLENGDLLNGASGWTLNNPTGGAGPGTWFGDGTINLNGHDEARYGDSIEQSFSSVAGATYDFSVDLSEEGWGYGHHNIGISIMDADGNCTDWQTIYVLNGQYTTKSFSFTATSDHTTVRIINDWSSNTWATDVVIHKVSVKGENYEPEVYEKGLVTHTMSHGADGTFVHDGKTYHFQNLTSDGKYVYGIDALEDDAKPSYHLSSGDLDFLIKQVKLGVVDASDLQDVSDVKGVRELSGFGNNVENPQWGNSDEIFERLVAASYKDGVSVLRDGPAPRDISNAVLNQNKFGLDDVVGPNAGDQDKEITNSFRGNEFATAFGQFFDHGLSFVPKGGVNGDGTAAGVITDLGSVAGNPMTLRRAAVDEGTGINGIAREHINQTSPFVDQNQAYGPSDKVLEFLLERAENGQFTGRLLADADGGLPTLGQAKANWQLGVDAGLVEEIDWSDPTQIFNFRGSGDALFMDVNRAIPLDDHLVAGDGRVNENAALAAVHEVWQKNHNFWVDKLIEQFHTEAHGHGCGCMDNGGDIPTPPGGGTPPTPPGGGTPPPAGFSLDPTAQEPFKLPDGLTTQHLFEMAKIINEAEYQRAVFDEFVEMLVGSDVHRFRDYNPNVNADITHEFAAATYRLGHTMLNNNITVFDESAGSNKQVPLFDLFLNPIKYKELGASNITDGLIDNLHQEIDAKVVTTVRNNLLGQPTDLASFNIARGRDVGLPTLNDMREAAGLERYKDWDDFGKNLRDYDDLARFKEVYANVDEIDLWVGGLAEKPSSTNGFGTNLAQNSVMGETFAQVFSIQMIGLQDGDRFYYKHRLFETELRLNLQNQDFADIVERTMGLEFLQADILKTVDNRLDYRGVDMTKLELHGTSGHDVIIGRNIGETIDGGNGDDTIFLRAGNDTANGEDGDDALHGGAGNDKLFGGSGDDRADGGSGHDRIFGGYGSDDMSGEEGNDYIDGGEGDDEVFGAAGHDHVIGGDGNDNVWGGLDNDRVEGGDGNDMVTGNDGDDHVYGGSGNDTIIGGKGDDYLEGGSGYDVFSFLPCSDNDVIKDFNIHEDRIDLHRYTWEYGRDIISVAKLEAAAYDSAAGLVLNLPGDATITLEGVKKSGFFDNAYKTLQLEDRVYGREGLILDKQTGIVVDAGTRDQYYEDPVTGKVTVTKAPDRHDFHVSVDEMSKNGFGTEEVMISTRYESFNSGGAGWSNSLTGTTNGGTAYLGGHGYVWGNLETAKTYDMGDGDTAVISFDLLEIDSWDGERFYVTINGRTIDLGQFYVDNVYGNRLEGSSGSSNGISWHVETAGYVTTNFEGQSVWSDEVHRVTITAANVGPEMSLGFGSSLNEGFGTNEAWGVAKLEVKSIADVASLRYPTYEKVVSSEDFSNGAQGWSDNTTRASLAGDGFLGGHGTRAGDVEVSKTFDLSPGADKVTLSFDFLEVDAWDNEQFYVTINGRTISLGNFYGDSLYGNRAEGFSGSQNGISWTVDNGYTIENTINRSFSDEVHKVTMTVQNVGSQLTVGFGSNLNEATSNESWGVDNFVLTETVKGSSPAASGSLVYTFDGDSGGYDVVVNSYDHSGGLARMEVLLNGDVMHTELLNQTGNTSTLGAGIDVIAENLYIKSGDKVEVKGYSDAGDYVRVDGLDFIAINDPYETLFV